MLASNAAWCSLHYGERQAIGDQGFTEEMAVTENMCSIDKLLVAEPADGAGTLVGGEHTFSESGLVNTLAVQSW